MKTSGKVVVLLGFKETSADSSATVMINEYLSCAAISAAKDGEALESSLDGSLREKQHKGGTVCVFLADESIQGSTTALRHP